MFEDEDLLQLAVGEAFEQAVAANFPAQLVRPDLRHRADAGRHVRPPSRPAAFAYKKFSRTPEVELTERWPRAIRTFGGVNPRGRAAGRGHPLPGRVPGPHLRGRRGYDAAGLARLERDRSARAARTAPTASCTR